jgi:hypothetical protein
MDELDLLNARIRRLGARRQELRRRGAGRSVLERNRLEIVRLQWKVSRALIEAHTPDERAA